MIRGYDSGYDSRVWFAGMDRGAENLHISTGRELSLELSSNSSGSGSSGSGSGSGSSGSGGSSGSNSGENMVWGVIRRYGLGV